MNNNETNYNRLKAIFSKFEKILGDDKASPLWHWLFDSAIKCDEYKMAEEIIRKMSAKTRTSAMVTLAVESKEEKYLEKVIELVYKKIEKENDLGYHILMKVIMVMAEAKEEKLNKKTFKEAKKIADNYYRKKAINIVIVSSSAAMVQRAETLECPVPGEDETLEEMFHFATTATEAIVAASKG